MRTVSSVSPKCWRRSECPTIAPSTPSSSSIPGEISPVNAPSAAQWTFCAYTGTPRPTAATSEVNGGQTTTSTPAGGSNASRNSTVDRGPLNIFQLPATSTGVILVGGVRTMTIDDIRYAKNGDVHLAYEVLGAGGGVDLVLIRTFVSQLEHYHRLPVMVSFTERLGRLGRVVCFDHRGTGLSDRVRGYRLPTIEERVDDLRTVLDAVGSERAVLVALADGGPLGCMFAGDPSGANHGTRPVQHETTDRLVTGLPMGHARAPVRARDGRHRPRLGNAGDG